MKNLQNRHYVTLNNYRSLTQAKIVLQQPLKDILKHKFRYFNNIDRIDQCADSGDIVILF